MDTYRLTLTRSGLWRKELIPSSDWQVSIRRVGDAWRIRVGDEEWAATREGGCDEAPDTVERDLARTVAGLILSDIHSYAVDAYDGIIRHPDLHDGEEDVIDRYESLRLHATHALNPLFYEPWDEGDIERLAKAARLALNIHTHTDRGLYEAGSLMIALCALLVSAGGAAANRPASLACSAVALTLIGLPLARRLRARCRLRLRGY